MTALTAALYINLRRPLLLRYDVLLYPVRRIPSLGKLHMCWGEGVFYRSRRDTAANTDTTAHGERSANISAAATTAEVPPIATAKCRRRHEANSVSRK